MSYFTHTNRALKNSLWTDTQYDDNLDAIAASFATLPTAEDLVLGLIQYREATSPTTDKYDVTITDVDSYSDGLTIRIQPLATNVSSAQIQINNLGYINVKRDNLEIVNGGDLVANSVYTLTYISSAASFILQTAPTSIVDEVSAIYDDFDDRYLGAKALEPSSNNDGDSLTAGSLYYNTGEQTMKVYTGVAWKGLNTYTKYVGDTEPSNPYHGQEWYDTASGVDYTYYDDGDSQQWLQQTLFAEGSEVIELAVNTQLTTTDVTVTGSLDITKNVNFINAASGDVTATLPTAVGFTGSFIHIKRIDSSANVVTVDTFGSETIDNYTTTTLSENQNLMVISDGTNWRIL